MNRKIFYSNSENETLNIAIEFSKTLKSGDVVALYGDLGAGKTAFVRGVCSNICKNAYVNSPTFAIVNEYLPSIKDDTQIKVNHFDMYRILTEDALYDLGFDDYLAQNALNIIEWSENIENYLNFPHIKVEIKGNANEQRTITITEMD